MNFDAFPCEFPDTNQELTAPLYCGQNAIYAIIIRRPGAVVMFACRRHTLLCLLRNVGVRSVLDEAPRRNT